MNYFIPKFDGYLLNSNFNFHKNAVYQLNFTSSDNIIVANNNLVIFNPTNLSNNFLKVKLKSDCFYFAFPTNQNTPYFLNLKHKNRNVQICLTGSLQVFIDDVCICEHFVDNLKFSHTENINDCLLIYFTGKRNFIVIIQGEKAYCTYFDEINKTDSESYIMCKCFDSLNHGKVYHIANQKVENYLVYLDNEDLNLKPEFLVAVFLDCVMVKNSSYLSNLLQDKQNAKQVIEFLPEFDDYFLHNNSAILIKNKELAGAFEFEINSNKISNILDLN